MSNKKQAKPTPSPFQLQEGGSMFSKKFLIVSAIVMFIMVLIAAFVDPEGFRNQVNNATFLWDEKTPKTPQ